MPLEIKPSVKPTQNLRTTLYAQLRFSAVLGLSESEFAKLIQEIENDPVFQKLLYPPDSGTKAILKKSFPHSKLSQSFYELKEDVSLDRRSFDVQSLLLKHREVVALIRKIGEKNFEKYFFYKDGLESVKTIMDFCGLSEGEVKRIQSFLTEFSINSEFFYSSSLPLNSQIHYTPIAKIEIEKNGELVIAYLSPHLACGRYILNQERFQTIKKIMDAEEKKSAAQLIKKMEWVNLRKDTLQRILQEAILRQEYYFRTGKIEKILPFSQRSAARIIGVAPSTICRAILGKSVILPWGKETALKDLFVSQKQVVQKHLTEILNEHCLQQKPKLNDEQLAKILMNRCHFTVSRRSVNLYRREISSG